MFVDSSALFQIIGVLLPVLLVASVVGVIYWTTHTVKMNKEIGNKAGNRYVLLTVLCLLLAGASWICNFGWLRVFLSWIGFPLFYGALFCFANCRAAARVAEKRTLKKYILLSSITYVIAYFGLLDFGDTGGAYVFFSLIRNDEIVYAATAVSLLSFVVNIVLLILEIVLASKRKKQTPAPTNETE